MKKITTDPAQRLDIYSRPNRTFQKLLTFQNADESAFDFSAYTLTLEVKKYQGDASVLSFSEGSGISISGGEITLSKTSEQFTLSRGNYIYEFIADNGTLKQTWLNGFLIVDDAVFDNFTESDTITVTTDGDPVTITVTGSSGGDISLALLKANNLSDLQSAATARTNLGLGNVNNTSDANKPVSTAQAAADANVLSSAIQRSNHTGTQTSSTISDFESAIVSILLSNYQIEKTATGWDFKDDSNAVAIRLNEDGSIEFPTATISQIGFESASGLNKIFFPENLADSLTFIDDAAIQYLRFITTTGESEVKSLVPFCFEEHLEIAELLVEPGTPDAGKFYIYGFNGQIRVKDDAGNTEDLTSFV